MPVVRAIEVSHEGCKDEFRRNPRCHIADVFQFLVIRRSPFGVAKATDTGGDARKTSNCPREAAWLGTVRKVE